MMIVQLLNPSADSKSISPARSEHVQPVSPEKRSKNTATTKHDQLDVSPDAVENNLNRNLPFNIQPTPVDYGQLPVALHQRDMLKLLLVNNRIDHRNCCSTIHLHLQPLSVDVNITQARLAQLLDRRDH
uniref:(northern house mosquito) hypothetical protein n=1 Tax=Culex pipiens TaxID=7175 RepID=A0A8D8MYW3_CULPI